MRGFGGSRGIGRTVGRGGGGGGGGGVQEVITNKPILNKPSSNTSSSSNNKSASLLSNLSVSSSIPLLAAASNGLSFFPSGRSSCSFYYDSDEWDWETVDGEEEGQGQDISDEFGNGFYDRLVFGQVPSMDEVEDVVTALKQVSSAGSQLDWIEPAMHVCNQRMLRSHGHERVYDAFHLLQTEPTVQRMVIALSTDKSVWNAVLSNEVVQEIKEAFYAAENDGLLEPGGNPDAKKSILELFMEKSKTKVMELIEKVSDLLSSIFQSQETKKDTTGTTNKFESNLRYSFMLSTVVLLIVILNRVYKA